MSDNKSQSIDHDTSSIPGHTAVNATVSFDLTDLEGERRLREMLDAGKGKLVLWQLDQWLRIFVKYGTEATEMAGLAVDEALDKVRKEIYRLCDYHGIRLDEE